MTYQWCAGVGGVNQACPKQKSCALWRPWWEGYKVDMNRCGSLDPKALQRYTPTAEMLAEAPIAAKGQQELFA